MRKAKVLPMLLVCICALIACQLQGYPAIDELLVDESSFPEGWEANEPDWTHPPRAPWSDSTNMVEYISRDFYSHLGDGASAIEEIRQFNNSRAAVERYEHEMVVTFRDTEWNTPWVVPAELSFESAAADQYHYACSMQGEGNLAQPGCAYVAQYGVYVVYFGIAIYDTAAITYAGLSPVMEAIDERFAQYVINE
jgi:hypothetical protein